MDWKWKTLTSITILYLALGFGIKEVSSWGSKGDKVLLRDVSVITLKSGGWTQGRRSNGVRQLHCLGGGTAGCGAMEPKVVQCYNRGSDGDDVQWECKADLDNAYRFGKVEVSCEGYDYPDDPYILKGSCGLEYTLDLTEEGRMYGNGQQHQHAQYGQSPPGYGWNVPTYAKPGKSNPVTNIVCGVVLVIMLYAFYKTCIAPTPNRQFSPTNDDHPDGRGGPGTRPPPPGFNPSFTSPDPSDESCSAGAGSARQQQGPRAGGFWTGAAAGGFLGYLFGARNNNAPYGGMFSGRQATYQNRPSYGGGYSGGGFSGFSGGSSGGGGSRSASGFGGTRRR